MPWIKVNLSKIFMWKEFAYFDVTQVTNMTIKITGSTVRLASWVEVGTNLVTITTKLMAFMHVHTMQTGLQAIDNTADFHRAARGGLLKGYFSVDFTFGNVYDGAAGSFDGLASATTDSNHYNLHSLC